MENSSIEAVRQQFAECALMPGEPGYEQCISIDNGRIEARPSIVLAPQSIEKISEIISFLIGIRVPVTIKGGGHGASGYSLNQGGIVIDLTKLNKVEIDSDAGLAHVQAGARWRDVYSALIAANTNLIAVGGGCVDVGVAGFLQGGGYSFVSRSYGMGIDNVVDLKIIVADGSILKISRDEADPQLQDLFWACLGGGGGNFGVLVDVTLRLHPPKTVKMAMIEMRFSSRQAREILTFMNKWEQTLPEEMAVYGIWRGTERIPDLGGDGHIFGFTIIYNGEFSAAMGLIAPLFAYSPTYMRTLQLPLPEFELLHGQNTVVSGAKCYMRSGVMPVGGWSQEVLAVIERNMSEVPNASCFLVWTHAGGKIEGISENGTSFPHRKAKFIPQIKAMWHNQAEKQRVIQWAKNFFDELDPYFIGSYVNYIDPLLSNWQLKYYGDNYDRLLQIKQHWDSENFFSFPQSIGSKYDPLAKASFEDGFLQHIQTLQY